MKIIVCINRVRYIYQPGAVSLSGQIDEEKTVFMLNPYDEAAVEEAIRIKEKVEDSEVILVAVGREKAEQTLRYACAMGGTKIDRLLRIDYDHFDPWTSSLLLAKVIEQTGFDIIFCGKKIIDSNATQAGAFISEFLNIPLVSGIVAFELFPQDGRAVVAKSLGKGDTEEIECMLPALFTTEMGINEPRYPTVPDRFFAATKEIDVVDPHTFGIDFTVEGAMIPVKKLSPPRLKARNVRLPDRNLSAIERLEMMKSGGGTKKDGAASLEGSPQESAEYIAEFLIQNRIITGMNTP